MKKLAEGGDDPGVVGRLGVELEGRSLLRDWDRNKVIMGYNISVCLNVLCPCLCLIPLLKVDQEKERERERLDERRGRREVNLDNCSGSILF